MGYAEAMAKLGMRMTKTNLARAEANPKVTITTPRAEPKADDGAAAAPRPTASSPGPKAPSTPSVVGKLLRGADRVGRASTAQAVREFHLKKEMMDFAEDQYALAETHGDQRGKAQRLSGPLAPRRICRTLETPLLFQGSLFQNVRIESERSLFYGRYWLRTHPFSCTSFVK